MKTQIWITGLILNISLISAQPFQQLNKLYSCRVKQLFNYRDTIYLVTNNSFYSLKEDSWYKLALGLPENNIFDVRELGGYFIALTYDGFYLMKENKKWEHLKNDGQLIIENKKKFSPSISEAFKYKNDIILIGNHYIFNYNVKNKVITDSIAIPFSLNRDFYFNNDTLLININNKCLRYDLEEKKIEELSTSYQFQVLEQPKRKIIYDSIEYDFEDYDLIISRNHNQIDTIYYPCSTRYNRGILKHNNNFLIASSKNGLFKYNPLNKSVVPFCEGINEGWFINLFVKENCIIACNPDGLYLFSLNHGIDWDILNVGREYDQHTFEYFKDNLVYSKGEKLFVLNKNKDIRSFNWDIKKLIEFDQKLFILTKNELYYTEDLNNFKEVILKDKKEIIFSNLMVFNERLFIKTADYITYKIDLQTINNPKLELYSVIPDSIKVHNNSSVSIIPRPDFSEYYYYNNHIFILTSLGRLYHSTDGENFHSIFYNRELLDIAFDNGILYYSFQEKGILKRKFK